MNPLAILTLLSDLVTQVDALNCELDVARKRIAELEATLTAEAEEPTI